MPEIAETYSYRGNNIYSVVHVPDNQVAGRDKVMVVFLHGWAGYRIGPHGMLTNIARHLASQGFHCCRFDFRGRGYSSGKNTDTDMISMLEDLELVIAHLREKYKPDEINLLGMCSGGKLAVLYAKVGMHKINHIITLSGDLLVGMDSNTRRKEAVYNERQYLEKIILRETWIKFFKGHINFRLIIGSLWPRKKHRKTGPDSSKPRTSGITDNKMPGADFSNFTGSALLIHAGNDPLHEASIKQYCNVLNKYGKSYSTVIIPGANHNYYSLKWEQQVTENVAAWLAARHAVLPDGDPDGPNADHNDR